MKKQLVTSTPSQAPGSEPALPAGDQPRKGLVRRWADFWFSATDPLSLHLVRFFSGLLFLFWLSSLAGSQTEFFSLNGWFDRQALREAKKQQDQPLPEGTDWTLFVMLGNNRTLINAFYYSSLGVLALFTLGVATRLTAPLTWVVVCSFLANPATLYEGDFLLVILAFYLMVGYALLGFWNGRRTWAGLLFGSCDALLWKTGRATAPSYSANLALRLLQVHFALAVVVSGLHKFQFGDWWGGAAFFYPLHPPLEITQEQLRTEAASASSWFFFLSLGQYLLLAWQLGFPLFAWSRTWRPLLVGGAIIGWVGSLYLYKLPLFGPVYLIASLSFVTADEWRGLGRALASLCRMLFGGRKPAPEPAPAGLQAQRA
jgi:hypothetical protein